MHLRHFTWIHIKSLKCQAWVKILNADLTSMHKIWPHLNCIIIGQILIKFFINSFLHFYCSIVNFSKYFGRYDKTNACRELDKTSIDLIWIDFKKLYIVYFSFCLKKQVLQNLAMHQIDLIYRQDAMFQKLFIWYDKDKL